MNIAKIVGNDKKVELNFKKEQWKHDEDNEGTKEIILK